MKSGLEQSFRHPQNGMIRSDMEAAVRAANWLDEVIIFRSTGPWSQRWIERRYPTKNFHVKGKSSDWGPQSGFIPYLGMYSKVGADRDKASKGTAANDHGIKDRYASKVQLALTLEELRLQADKPEEIPSRKAVESMTPIPDSRDFLLIALRSGDRKKFAFRAVWSGGTVYHIFVLPDSAGSDMRRLMFEKGTPLEVMTSTESGADNKPMTGDYDLMAVCPRWGNYGSKSVVAISKPALQFKGKPANPIAFPAGSQLDGVLDMSTNTGAIPVGGNLKSNYQGLGAGQAGRDEHPDLGNVTPRILRCINRLNIEMGNAGALRRVHHNAESHRNHLFGALTGADMDAGDGLPLTVFQPLSLALRNSPTNQYSTVSTLESLAEFRVYSTQLNDAGYFVPRNWTWGMSVRDRVAA